MKELFVRTKEKQYGPLAEHEFRRMVIEGKITSEDLIWHYYKNSWVEAGKIEKFSALFNNGKNHRKKKKIIAIGSGKGGVGKTALTISMGMQLASLNKNVVLVDADFSSPNLHQWMGISQPSISLQAFFENRISDINDVALKTSQRNLRIVCGAIGNLGIANLRHFQSLKFMGALHNLDADIVLLDLSPGCSLRVVDLFLSADESVMVTVPETAAIVDSFSFLKICLLRKFKQSVKYSKTAIEILNRYEAQQTGHLRLSLRTAMAEIQRADDRAYSICSGILRSFIPKLILNMVFNKDEDQEGYVFAAAIEKLLLIHVDYLGYFEYDYNARESSRTLGPFYLAGTKYKGLRSFSELSSPYDPEDQKSKSTRKWQNRIQGSRLFASPSTVGSTLFGDVVEESDLYV